MIVYYVASSGWYLLLTTLTRLAFQSLRSVKYPDGHVKTPLEPIIQEGSTASQEYQEYQEYQEETLPGRLPLNLESKVVWPGCRASTRIQGFASSTCVCFSSFHGDDVNSNHSIRRDFLFCLRPRQDVYFVSLSDKQKMYFSFFLLCSFP